MSDKRLKILSIFSLVLFLNTSTRIFAQGNLPYTDDKLFHFGFSVGLNAMDFGVTSSLEKIDGKIYDVSVSSLQPGFSVGVTTDMRLSRYFNLRFTPTFHFAERVLTYKVIGENNTNNINITSVPICVPIYLKYSAERIKNVRPYLIAGVGGYYDLARNADKPILLKPLDFYIEVGTGCDLYFPFFKMSPELKFAIGFNDMLTPLDQRNSGVLLEENKKYTSALTKLTSRMLTLTFNFE